MSAITVTSSINVKPALARDSPGVVGGLSIERLGRALRVDVVDVLAAPRVAVGVVLVAVQAPLRVARHRVDRDPTQELQLAVERAHPVHALPERLEVGRVALAAELRLRAADLPRVGRGLVAVDLLAQLAQRPAQLE